MTSKLGRVTSWYHQTLLDFVFIINLFVVLILLQMESRALWTAKQEHKISFWKPEVSVVAHDDRGPVNFVEPILSALACTEVQQSTSLCHN